MRAMRAAALLLCSAVLLAQDAPRATVLDGVYSAVQAMRGEAQYQMRCAGCHGEDLTGRAMGALKGDKFLDRWREDSLGILFDYMRTKMPASVPGSLSERAYLDILAYILQENSIPPGSKELTAADVIAITLVGKAGPQPLSTNTLVQVSGCAIQEDKDWVLISATEPARTRTPKETTPEELKQAVAKPPGSQRFGLQDVEDLSGFIAANIRNQRVQVKGVLIRQANGYRINVLKIDVLGANCK
jgi:S-disulfanyl-L-cysteine oxidoreductase SoxD